MASSACSTEYGPLFSPLIMDPKPIIQILLINFETVVSDPSFVSINSESLLQGLFAGDYVVACSATTSFSQSPFPLGHNFKVDNLSSLQRSETTLDGDYKLRPLCKGLSAVP